MPARERPIMHGGSALFRTPLLVPSFSSKGFPELRKIVSLMSEFITGPVLVSAYDLFYRKLLPSHLAFPSVLFLDSGGYEARVEHDLSEAYGADYCPKAWVQDQHEKVLSRWKPTTPTVAVNYDNPERHTALSRQLESAQRQFRDHPAFVPEFLIKPEQKGAPVDVQSIRRIAPDLKTVAIIGITERELGDTLIRRMETIAEVRRILDSAGVQAPIHVFGSLDTLSTALYYVAGAEIFDGLTWLRFGYHDGTTMYSQNYGAIRTETGLLKTAGDLAHSMWKDNYYYLESLTDNMRSFARDGDFAHFGPIETILSRAANHLWSRLHA